MSSNVQAELQQYLKDKNLNTLFVSIVEALLIDKPDNPIAYIVTYLKVGVTTPVGGGPPVSECVPCLTTFSLA